MKLKLKFSLLYLIIAVICTLIALGIAVENLIIMATLCTMFTYVGMFALFEFGTHLVDYLQARAKHKKKIKNKRTRLKVEFIDPNEITSENTFSLIFSGYDLASCFQNIYDYANLYQKKVKSITVLTTEE